jgi:DNA-binding transcriptional LysR family regulator
MNLTLRQLRAFAAIAESGSFTAAAHTLHLTQSALSVMIREMEQDIGLQLLDRHTRKVQLSEAGAEFLPSVHRMLGDLGVAVASLTDLRDQKRGLLRLAAPQLMACTLMPRVIAAYRALYPAVDVRLTDTLPEQLIATVSSGRVELAIGQDVAVDAGLDRRALFRDRHWLICRPDHPLAARKKARWRDLTPYRFIAPTRDFRQRVLPELDADTQAYLSRVETQEVSYMTTALGMVSSGLGITVCPTYASSLVQSHGLHMVPLVSPQFHREVCIYSAARRTLSPAAASFVQVLEKVASQ